VKRVAHAITLLVFIVLGVVYAATFAYRYIGGVVNVAPPVVYYADPGTPGVNVTLYNQGTKAAVNASIPAPTIQLVHRSAIFYDTFDTNPIAEGRFQNISCTWTWSSTARAIQISAGSRGPARLGFECVLLANVEVSSYVVAGREVYVAFLAWRGSFTAASQIRIESVYFNTTNNRFYTIGFNNTLLTGRTGDNLSSTILYWGGAAWSTIAYRYIGVSYTIEYNYTSYVASSINFSSWFAYHWNQTILANGTIPVASRVPVNRVGIGYWVNTTLVIGTVYFDNFVVTVDFPPWFVNVTGLQPSWRAVLRNSTGGIVANETAGIDGVAVLNVAPRLVDLQVNPNYRDGFIFPNATIEVYDDKNRLVASLGPTTVVGGDWYSVVYPSLKVLAIMSMLINQPFHSKLTLVNISGCYDSFVEVYLVNTNNTYSTPIRIRWGIIESQETSTLYMTPQPDGTAGYIEVKQVYIPTGLTCSLTVLLQYTYSNWSTTGILRADMTLSR